MACRLSGTCCGSGCIRTILTCNGNQTEKAKASLLDAVDGTKSSFSALFPSLSRASAKTRASVSCSAFDI